MTLPEALSLINSLNEELFNRRLTLGDCITEMKKQDKLISALRKEIKELRNANEALIKEKL